MYKQWAHTCVTCAEGRRRVSGVLYIGTCLHDASALQGAIRAAGKVGRTTRQDCVGESRKPGYEDRYWRGIGRARRLKKNYTIITYAYFSPVQFIK